jgi:hypothetical protein
MAEPFIGSEAVASGVLVKSALRTQYTKLFRDVYVSPDTELTHGFARTPDGCGRVAAASLRDCQRPHSTAQSGSTSPRRWKLSTPTETRCPAFVSTAMPLVRMRSS